MAPAGKNPSALRTGSIGEPIEQGRVLNSVDPEWLNQYEKLAEAERLARLDTDRQLVDELRGSNFQGVHWNYYATELVKYGLAVLTGWTVRGMILEKARRHAFGGLPKPLDDALLDHNMAEELAGETIARALNAFRTDVLIPGVWDPAKGASIKTFFIGQCLKQFANVYRSWHHETYGDVTHDAYDIAALPEHVLEHHSDVATKGNRQIEVSNVLARIKNPQVKEAFVLAAAGHNQEEIGRRLGVSTKTVERMMYNERARQKKVNVA